MLQQVSKPGGLPVGCSLTDSSFHDGIDSRTILNFHITANRIRQQL